jgi:peptidoglycan-N-acetylglucosamine deacetylase
MPTILWSVDTLDWQHRNSEKLMQIVKRQVTNGSIILMHDTNNASLKGLENVIYYLQKNDYEIVTVSEILTPVQ